MLTLLTVIALVAWLVPPIITFISMIYVKRHDRTTPLFMVIVITLMAFVPIIGYPVMVFTAFGALSMWAVS